VGAHRILEGKRIAELCGIDLKPLAAEAEKTYPVPKSWKGLKADGTPRVVKAKAKKKRGVCKCSPEEIAAGAVAACKAEEAKAAERSRTISHAQAPAIAAMP
jgi:hypothetical protein